jgi:hypothetical protein
LENGGKQNKKETKNSKESDGRSQRKQKTEGRAIEQPNIRLTISAF